MNIQLASVTGFGPIAWNRNGTLSGIRIKCSQKTPKIAETVPAYRTPKKARSH